MACEQTNGQPPLQFQQDHEGSTLKEKCKSLAGTAPENVNGSLDCNICLDSAHDPVVTLCGHLYCWPCIYKWLNVRNTSSFKSDEEPKCPVCKAIISQALLVPLYGRGVTSVSEVKRAQLDHVIPRRPHALELDAMVTAAISSTSRSTQPHSYPSYPPHLLQYQQQQFPHSDENYQTSPTVGSVGGMVLSRMFLSLFAYPSQNTYPLMGYGSPAMRRQDMLVAKSLNRVTIFLLCCVMLCLLLF